MVENQENTEQKDILLDVDETKENKKEKEIKGNNNNILSSNIEEHKPYNVDNENLISQNSGVRHRDDKCCRICKFIMECPSLILFSICVCFNCIDPP